MIACFNNYYFSLNYLLESEDEFYDAPSSPLEDLPFFEAPLGSLNRASSFRKNTAKPEPLKNMTDFQLRFEISEVMLYFLLLKIYDHLCQTFYVYMLSF